MEQRTKHYVQDWDSFLSTTVDIIMTDPRARASIKYNHHKQTAILKVTDNKRVILYKVKVQKQINPTASKQIQSNDFHFNQIEQFINVTSKLMLKCDPQEVNEEPTEEKGKGKKKKGKGAKK